MEPARLPFLLCVVDLQRLCAGRDRYASAAGAKVELAASERRFIRGAIIALFALNWVYLLIANPSL